MSGASSSLLRHVQHLVEVQRNGSLSDHRLLERFATQRDETAFEVLVQRHGPMVLSVCRRVLGHEQDAEDAFQAAFLILARKGGEIRRKDVGCFLYRLAYRLAIRARGQKVKRLCREHRTESVLAPDPVSEVTWREVRQIVDEETQRLPERLRSPLVLCYLEGKTQDEAAQLLGWSKSTLRRRLTQARERLQRRLVTRGLVPMVALTASLFAEEIEAAALSALARTTVRAAVSGTASPSIAALVEAGCTLVSASKTKVATLLLLTVSLLSAAGVSFFASSPRQQEQSLPARRAGENTADASLPAKRNATQTIEIHGRVLDPDGKPRAGAKLALLSRDDVRQVGVTAKDGRFTVIVPKERKGEWPPALLAQGGDAGLDFISLAGCDTAKPVELRLAKDQAIRGRVVNLEGKPIPGVHVSVSGIDVYSNNSLESLLARSQKNPADFVLPPGEKTLWLLAASFLDAITDVEGHFVISGIGAGRVAELYLREGGIAKTRLRIVNHDSFDPKPLNPFPFFIYGSPGKMMNSPPAPRVQGQNVSVVAEPEKPIHGVVKYADSGKGAPNAVVRLEQREDAGHPFVRTKTDAQGRYEFRGAHKAKTYSLYVDSDSSTGYLPTQIQATDTVGYSPVNVDFRIKKGVIVTGKIIDKATGKAVPGFAQFRVLVNNPFAKDYPGVTSQREETAEDGTFRVVVIPGPVLLTGGYYPPSTKSSRGPVVLLGGHYPPSSANFDYIEFLKYQGNYRKALDIKPGTAVVHQDMLLERASVLEVKIQDTDGQPVEGVWATDFAALPITLPVWIDRSTCPVYSLEQRKPRLLTFYEPKKKIIGWRRLQGDEKGPVVVKLGPTGAIKGRLLDTDGKPMTGALVGVMYREMSAGQIHQHIHRSKQVVTDAAGSFTVDELIPDLMFELAVYRGKRHFEREAKTSESAIQVKPGECRDLGSIKLKPVPEKAGGRQ